jgi:hypothetical protein
LAALNCQIFPKAIIREKAVKAKWLYCSTLSEVYLIDFELRADRAASAIKARNFLKGGGRESRI